MFWLRCPCCGHKLFRIIKDSGLSDLEIKCHSCKSIVNVKHENGETQYEIAENTKNK